MRIASLACAFLLLAAGASFAQSTFFPEGKNGYFFGGSFVDGDGFSGFELQAAHSVAGVSAIGVAAGKLSRDGDLEAEWDDFEESSITPYFSVLVLRPGGANPFGIEATLAYSYHSFSGDITDGIDQESHGSALGVGLDFSLAWSPASFLTLRPYLSVAYFGGSISSQAEWYDHDENNVADPEEVFDSADMRQLRASSGLSIQIKQEFIFSSGVLYYDDSSSLVTVAFHGAIPSKSEW